MTEVVVVGCGSIGLRHIRNLISLGIDVLAVDIDPERVRMAANLGARPIRHIDEAVQRKTVAGIVCTPPNRHLETGRALLEGGLNVFVEKPIAHDLADARELIDCAARRERVLYVGYNLRFHPGLRKLRDLLTEFRFGRALSFKIEFGQYLPDWRPSQDYRKGYNTREAEGGGIILDASHEIDYLLWLAGDVETVQCDAGHLSTLEMDAEDVAAITFRTCAGALAEMHLDCVQRGYCRNCKVICENGTIIWDFRTGISWFGPDGVESFIDGTDLRDVNQLYIDEISHFMACVRGESSPNVDGKTAMRVLEVALAARVSAARPRNLI